MTRKEAEAVNKDRIVAVIGPNRLQVVRGNITKLSGPKEENRMLSRSDQGSNETRLQPRVLTPWYLERRDPSALHLMFLSKNPTFGLTWLYDNYDNRRFLYLHERTSGRGATIYIIEPGFPYLNPVGPGHFRGSGAMCKSNACD